MSTPTAHPAPRATAAGLAEAEAHALLDARHGDPFRVLGPHPVPDGVVVRAIRPGARRVEVVERKTGAAFPLAAQPDGVLFAGPAGAFAQQGPSAYVLRTTWPDGVVEESEDPYAFPLLLTDDDLYFIGEGTHLNLADALGARAMAVDGIAGVRFALWAPHAAAASVIGDFNMWDPRRHPMRRRNGGVWELFVPRLSAGAAYMFELIGPDGARLPRKADPVARATQCPPATASIVADPAPFHWQDGAWMESRASRHTAQAPLSFYEVHASSWIHPDGRLPDWEALGDRLIPYATDLGFTHLELMPVMEHPFGGSWGYQPLGLFAPTARLGPPDAFARFVDRCHQAGLGVILDWVPAHFPSDAHGLAHFDGTALYEYADPREGFHPDWNSLIYDLSKPQVAGFLIASALEWLRHFHVDGLRVDAVASMLYRDYSRKPGEWIPNIHGGKENLEAIAFLRRLNETVARDIPGALVIAEESTAWPGVTAPVSEGGLGFSFKWNMGWMHDSLRYMGRDPIHRRFHGSDLTFGLVYAFSERYVLPISHDEVVHGKGSLLARMPGDDWQRMANLRAYLGFMWGHPGKKLLFQGCEIAQPTEWNHDSALPWPLLAEGAHRGVQSLVRDLNRLYRAHPALHAGDADPGGFRWIVEEDAENSVFAFLREAPGAAPVLVICNMTPTPRQGYRIGVPTGGRWRELLNTDAPLYGGTGVGNLGGATALSTASHGFAHALDLTLPPLAALFLTPQET